VIPIFIDAGRAGLLLAAYPVDLFNGSRMRIPDRNPGWLVRVDNDVLLRDDGKLYF
jgi:hypothetical protein